MNKQLAPIDAFTQDLAKHEKQFKSMLPAGLDPKRFMRTAVNGIKNHKQKDQLLKCNRDSLFVSCQKAASDGLMLDGREATLICFGQEATYIPMVQGLIKLARQSGDVGKITAYVVYENDEFQFRQGVDNIPSFDPDWKIAPSKRGEPCLAVAVINLKSDEPIVSILHRERIMKIAGKNNLKQYDPNQGPHFEEWWKKTVIRNALKYAPKSDALEQALEAESDLYDGPTEPERQQTQQFNDVSDVNKDLEVDTDTGEIIDAEFVQEEDDDII